MDMKKIEQEYQKFYNGLPEIKDPKTGKIIQHKTDSVKGKIEANIKKFEQEINSLGHEKTFYEHLKTDPTKAAILGFDDAALDAEITKIDDKLKDDKEKLQKQKDALEKFKADMDQTLEQLRQDPAISAQLDEILAKRYDRKMAKVEEQRNNSVKEKDAIDVIAVVKASNPLMQGALYDFINYEANKKDKIEQIKALNTADPDYATKLATLKSEIKAIEKSEEQQKKSLYKTIKLARPILGDKDIDAAFGKLVDNIQKVNGKLRVDETIKRAQIVSQREIRRADKLLQTNSVALAKTGVTLENPKSQTAKDIKTEFDKTEAQKVQEAVDKAKQTERQKLIDAENARRKALIPAQKPKWYQFVTRFQQWRNRRQYNAISKIPVEDAIKADIQKAEAKAEQDTLDSIQKAKDAQKTAKSVTPTMRDALKYDVVKHIVNEETNKRWKDAKQAIKDNEPEK